MLALIGWLFLVIIGASVSASWLVIAFCHMGHWTIGGAVNSIPTRVGVAILGLVLALYWYWVYTVCPFTITLN